MRPLVAAGYVALASDLYHGQKVAPGEPDEAGKAMMAMKMDQVGTCHERRGRRGAAAERRSKVGVIGFCMGGGLACSVLATQRPDAVAAVVPCYGIVPWPDVQPDYAAMSAVVLGHYAEKDEYFTPEKANELAAQLRGYGQVGGDHRVPGRRSRLLQRHAARGLRRRRVQRPVGSHVVVLL